MTGGLARLEQALVAVIVVGVLAAGGIVLVGPRLEVEQAAGHPTPIAGPITPAGFPYSSVALLRRQRMSNDVLPKSFTDDDPQMVAASARHVASTGGHGNVWVGVNFAGNLCAIYTSPGDGGASACDVGATSASTGVILGAGFGNRIGMLIASDGTAPTGKERRGLRQVSPNVWMSGATTTDFSAAPARERDFSDPNSFPLDAPYSRFAILRRVRTNSDAAPSFLVKQTPGPGGLAPVDLTTLRYAGSYKSSRVWVGVNTVGKACIVVAGSDGVLATACVTDMPHGRGVQAVDVGAGNILATLYTDGNLAKSDTQGKHRLAPNVWVAPVSD